MMVTMHPMIPFRAAHVGSPEKDFIWRINFLYPSIANSNDPGL
jgi:hypothetical protein